MLSLNDVHAYWQYYLSIEKNLAKTTDYVEVNPDNDKTYSIEYAKIIMLTCSEIETICRLLCVEIDVTSGYNNPNKRGSIDKYAKIILKKFPKLVMCCLGNIRRHSTIFPFKDWQIAPVYKSPKWWTDCNSVKHSRHSSYNKATQSNAFYAVAGLLILNLYLYRLVANEPYANPNMRPKLFNSDTFPHYLVTRADKELPDFDTIGEMSAY
jgi:hypothetical protein